jgi:hypothetical protein
MNTYSTLDRESFQKFLANAFAIQQSRIDSQSLSAIVEVQRLITGGDLDVDGTLHLVADRAQSVANATGVAIGLLEGDQLVYRAGSGTAATYVGQSVTATLAVSADSKVNREILRVEDADTDPRIEAAICREFGAKSLLILLICHDHSVVGVLEVFFSETHAFQDREVRTYRLMVGLVGEAMSYAARLEEKRTLKVDSAKTLPAVQPPLQGEKVLNRYGSALDLANNHAIFQSYLAATAVAGELLPLRQLAGLATNIMQRAKRLPWQTRRWRVAALATVVMVACLIAYSYRRPASSLGSSTLQRPIATEQQVSSKELPAADKSALQTATVRADRTSTGRIPARRVRVSDTEVDYIREDVTVRYFTPKPTPHRVRVGENEVAHLGDDVTVRYLTPKPGVGRSMQVVGGATPPVATSWSVPAKSVSSPSKPTK